VTARQHPSGLIILSKCPVHFTHSDWGSSLQTGTVNTHLIQQKQT